MRNMNRTLWSLFCIYLMFSLTIFSAFGLSIENVQTTTQATQATITWQTDESATGFVNLTDGAQTFTQSSSGFDTTHSATVTGLDPATTYTFQTISVSANDQTESTPQTLTTPPDTTALFLQAQFPEFVGIQPFTIQGQAPEGTLIALRVNNVPAGFTVAGEQNTFTFRNIRVPQTDTFQAVIEAEDPDTQEILTESQTIHVDTKAPTVELDKLPAVSTSGGITIAGEASEEVRLEIFSSDQRGNIKQEFSEVVNGTFSEALSLDEGETLIKIFATDRANNEISTTHRIYVDTSPPTILTHNINDLSPAYSPTVTITGTVDEPNVSVRIFINPEIDGALPCQDGIDNDGDGKTDFLDDPGCSRQDDRTEDDHTGETDCNDRVDNDGDGKTDFLSDPGCESQQDNSEGSDGSKDFVETRANDQGVFSKEVVIKDFFSLSNFEFFEGPQARANQARDQQDRRERTNINTQDNTANSLRFDSDGTTGNNPITHLIRIEAIDRVGQRDVIESTIEVGTCGQGGEWSTIQSDLFPAIIQPDLLFEGVAQLSFNLDFEFIGNGASPYISSISLANRDLSVADRDDFSPSQILDPRSNCRVFPEGGTDSKAHVVCNLNRFPPERLRNVTAAYDRLEELQTLTFPLRMELDYQVVNQFGETVSKFQETCFDVEVALDQRVKPDDIPRGLLEGSVEVLNSTIDTIDQILVPLRTITLATTGACLASHVALFFQTASMQGACLGYQEHIAPMQAILAGASDESSAQSLVDQNICTDDNQQNTILGTTCQGCFEAVKATVQTQEFYTTICDRVFCPATPTAQKHISDVNRNSASAKASACDQNSPFFPGTNSIASSSFKRDEGCGKEYYDQWANSCLGYQLDGDDIVQDSKDLETGEPGEGIQGILNSLNNVNFCKAAQEQDSDAFIHRNNAYLPDDEIGPDCYTLGTEPIERSTLVDQDDKRHDPNEYTFKKDEYVHYQSRDWDDKKFGEAKISKCVRTDKDNRLFFVPNDQNGNPAFYDASGDANRESLRGHVTRAGKPEESIDVQIYKEEAGKQYAVGQDGQYYIIDGTNADGVAQLKSAQDDIYYAYKGRNDKNVEDIEPRKGAGEDVAKGDAIVRGPDQLRSRAVPDILIDAKSNFINSLRCVCLPAIQGYLEQIRNILAAIRNCFQGILVSDEFNPGMCRAVLTQYLCDWIFEALGCFVKASGLTDAQLEERVEPGDVTSISKSLTALNRAGSSVKEFTHNRYGGTASFNTLFTERKLQHAVCLAAFGYDWLPELESAVDVGADGFAINTSAFIFPASRRFQSSNPFQQGAATFMYHVGYFVAAGDDINYRVELVCSADSSCDPEQGFENGRCDCSFGAQNQFVPPNQVNVANPDRNLFNTQTTQQAQQAATGEKSFFVDGGFLSGGDTTEGEGEIFRQITDRVRYDKVRLTWTPTRNFGESFPGQVLIDLRQAGERPPADCNFNLALQRFACNVEVTQSGDVFFNTEPFILNGNQKVAGDKVQVQIDTTVQFPETIPPEQQPPKWAKITMRDERGRIVGGPTTHSADILFLTQGMPKVFPPGDQGLIIGGGQGFRASSFIGLPTPGRSIINQLSDIQVQTQREIAVRVELDPTGTAPSCKFGVTTISDRQTLNQAINNIKSNDLTSCTYEQLSGTITIPSVAVIRVPSSQKALIDNKQEKLTTGFQIVRDDATPLRCPAGQTHLEYEVEISLHDSIPINPNRDVSFSNAQPSPIVASFGGAPQVRKLPLQVLCNEFALDNQVGGVCQTNTIFGQSCACGATLIEQLPGDFADASQNQQGVLPLAYCSKTTTTDEEGKEETKSEKKKANVNTPMCQIGTVGSTECWCSNKDIFNNDNSAIDIAKLRSAGGSIGISYCDPGQLCDNERCSQP